MVQPVGMGAIVRRPVELPAEEPLPSRTKFSRLAELRKTRECEQVAAVCYRLRNGSIEFLLVRTRGGGRWTFPKGSAEPGLTHAQAAALEAFEEAGVHGRIEEAAFAEYFRSATKPVARCTKAAVRAHLCEVTRLGPPKERNRNRTWFLPEEAEAALREGRQRAEATQFVKVIEQAVARIQKCRAADPFIRSSSVQLPITRPTNAPRWSAASTDPPKTDALRKVKFDFAETSQWREVAQTSRRRETIECEVLEFDSAPKLKLQ